MEWCDITVLPICLAIGVKLLGGNPCGYNFYGVKKIARY